MGDIISVSADQFLFPHPASRIPHPAARSGRGPFGLARSGQARTGSGSSAFALFLLGVRLRYGFVSLGQSLRRYGAMMAGASERCWPEAGLGKDALFPGVLS